jgi:hypothetical protein
MPGILIYLKNGQQCPLDWIPAEPLEAAPMDCTLPSSYALIVQQKFDHSTYNSDAQLACH